MDVLTSIHQSPASDNLPLTEKISIKKVSKVASPELCSEKNMWIIKQDFGNKDHRQHPCLHPQSIHLKQINLIFKALLKVLYNQKPFQTVFFAVCSHLVLPCTMFSQFY